jgi:hypothetical protein
MFRRNVFGKLVPDQVPLFTTAENAKEFFQDDKSENTSFDRSTNEIISEKIKDNHKTKYKVINKQK